MAQYYPAEMGYALNIDGKYYSSLDIEGFSQIMMYP